MNRYLMRTLARVSRDMMRQAGPRARDASPGQAIIEFAIVLPVMLLIALGAIDVGRVFFDYIGIRNAAMDGAVYGARHPSDLAGAEQRVRDHFLPNAIPAGLGITRSASANCTGTNSLNQDGFVTVTVTRTFSPLSLAMLQLAGPGTGWTFPVTSTAKARCMT